MDDSFYKIFDENEYVNLTNKLEKYIYGGKINFKINHKKTNDNKIIIIIEIKQNEDVHFPISFSKSIEKIKESDYFIRKNGKTEKMFTEDFREWFRERIGQFQGKNFIEGEKKKTYIEKQFKTFFDSSFLNLNNEYEYIIFNHHLKEDNKSFFVKKIIINCLSINFIQFKNKLKKLINLFDSIWEMNPFKIELNEIIDNNYNISKLIWLFKNILKNYDEDVIFESFEKNNINFNDLFSFFENIYLYLNAKNEISKKKNNLKINKKTFKNFINITSFYDSQNTSKNQKANLEILEDIFSKFSEKSILFEWFYKKRNNSKNYYFISNFDNWSYISEDLKKEIFFIWNEVLMKYVIYDYSDLKENLLKYLNNNLYHFNLNDYNFYKLFTKNIKETISIFLIYYEILETFNLKLNILSSWDHEWIENYLNKNWVEYNIEIKKYWNKIDNYIFTILDKQLKIWDNDNLKIFRNVIFNNLKIAHKELLFKYFLNSNTLLENIDNNKMRSTFIYDLSDLINSFSYTPDEYLNIPKNTVFTFSPEFIFLEKDLKKEIENFSLDSEDFWTFWITKIEEKKGLIIEKAITNEGAFDIKYNSKENKPEVSVDDLRDMNDKLINKWIFDYVDKNYDSWKTKAQEHNKERDKWSYPTKEEWYLIFYNQRFYPAIVGIKKIKEQIKAYQKRYFDIYVNEETKLNFDEEKEDSIKDK